MSTELGKREAGQEPKSGVGHDVSAPGRLPSLTVRLTSLLEHLPSLTENLPPTEASLPVAMPDGAVGPMAHGEPHAKRGERGKVPADLRSKRTDPSRTHSCLGSDFGMLLWLDGGAPRQPTRAWRRRRDERLLSSTTPRLHRLPTAVAGCRGPAGDALFLERAPDPDRDALPAPRSDASWKRFGGALLSLPDAGPPRSHARRHRSRPPPDRAPRRSPREAAEADPRTRRRTRSSSAFARAVDSRSSRHGR